jgi:hypothetical protein
MVYRKDRRLLKGPGYIAAIRTDAEGYYQIDLLPGEYRMAVRKRRDGAAAGFLNEGDLSAEYGGNPFRIAPDEYLDVGTISLHEVDSEKIAAARESRFQESLPTRLEGRVIDSDGNPQGGQFVFLYRDEGMIGRPDFLTTSDEEGHFVINLADGGKYYLGARSRFGGPRQPGERVGRLEDSPDSSVTVEAGTIVDTLQVTMEEAW